MASFPKPDSRPLENCDVPRIQRPELASEDVGRRSSRPRADEPRIRYYLRPDSTPEVEVETLQRVYRFVLECYERKQSDGIGHGELATEVGNAEGSLEEPSLKDEVH